MNIIIKNLNKYFGEKEIFNNFNLTIKEKKINFLMAPSGFGKTTLVNILLNLLEKDSGEIFGLENKKISVVFQENRLIEELSVRINLNLIFNNKKQDEFLNNELKIIGLENILNTKIKLLSGGMKRRVSILRGLLYDFDVLILDEPFKEIDENNKLKIINYMKGKIKNKTVIIITHNKEDYNLLGGELINLEVI